MQHGVPIAEISFDLTMAHITMPGVAVAGKLVVAQISKELVVLMVGLLGHQVPLFSLADWSATKTEVEASTRSLIIHLVDCSPAGSLFQINAGTVQSCQPAVKLRVVLDNQAAFLALAYLTLKSSLTMARPTVDSFCPQDEVQVTRMLEFFKGDDGPEFCTGNEAPDAGEDHPPDYTGTCDMPNTRTI
ncbi:hypothetical protein DFH06DRAFT_1327640 [Mycena polygramma]|nr:hypothetical protein DFH06DRAFT_1346949 [Mycena polygramma]KAJ7658363.1 hypothetical protein DFH06DRAFT_1327640 [Mycena polygramma]